jgi:opacity protein-like surface antigen
MHLKNLYLASAIPVIFTSSLAFAEIKPYIEGQINFYNPDDVRSNPETLAISSGGATLTASATIENEYDTDTVGGVEFGFKLNKNSRVGFSYSKPDFELENITISASATFTDGTNTIGDSAQRKFSRQEMSTVIAADTFDNEVKLYSFNYYYDFDSSSDIKPFLGLGIGLADIKNADDKELMYSFHGGARYFIADNTYLGAKASYSTIEGIKDGFGLTYEDIDLYSGSLVLGIEF